MKIQLREEQVQDIVIKELFRSLEDIEGGCKPEDVQTWWSIVHLLQKWYNTGEVLRKLEKRAVPYDWLDTLGMLQHDEEK